MNMNITFDDMRDMGDIIGRTFESCLRLIDILDMNGDTLFLDHDLGDKNPQNTGYGLITYLINTKRSSQWPQTVYIVTSNPVGRQNIAAVLENARSTRNDVPSDYDHYYRKVTPTHYEKVEVAR